MLRAGRPSCHCLHINFPAFFVARRTTTRYPQSGAKALTGPRVPPIFFSFSEAPMTATDFGSNTVRKASRRTSFMSPPPDQFTRVLRGPADDDALPATGRQVANGSARPAYLLRFPKPRRLLRTLGPTQ